MRASLLAFFIIPVITIQTGTATAKSDVTTDVGGGGTVQTSITTNVNGKVTTTESNQAGKIEVIATSGGTIIHTTPADILATPTAIVSPTPAVEQPFFTAMKTFLSVKLRSLLQKIFSLFSFHS